MGFKGDFRAPDCRKHGVQGRLSPVEALAASWRLEFRHPLTSDLAAPICLTFKADLSKRKRVKQKEVKEAHEKAIGRQLLKALKLNGKFLRHGEDDGEPDLIYSLDGKTMGIEIATAFYHNEQAEIESQLALGKLESARFGTPLGVPNDQDKVILSGARWELNDKCSKSYSGMTCGCASICKRPFWRYRKLNNWPTLSLFLLVTSLPGSTSVFMHFSTEKVSLF